MRSKSQNFGRGGTYTCGVCKKLTRATGRGDNEHVKLCAACYDDASQENTHADEHAPEIEAHECPECKPYLSKYYLAAHAAEREGR